MTITNSNWLYTPYILNIIILVPVCYSLFSGNGAAGIFENKIMDSKGLSLLVASLWLSILVASIAGLIWPSFFASIILIQIFYKSVWLLSFILPLLIAGKPYPVGISICFGLIIMTYPLFLWMSTK